jgi:hypothetical protein
MNRRERCRAAAGASPCACKLRIERSDRSAELALRALAGDPKALAATSVLLGWLQQFRAGRRAHCFACDHRRLRAPDGIVVMLPVLVGDALAEGFCPPCSRLPNEVLTKNIFGVIPGARLQVVRAGGRA